MPTYEEEGALLAELFNTLETINKDLERLRGPVTRAKLLLAKVELLGHIVAYKGNNENS